ncbi:hypothetical protein D3C73_593730 [compost metagenome]
MAFGFIVTASLLLREITKFFRMVAYTKPRLRQDIRRYPSLLFIGFFMGMGMFQHQISQWIMNGEWVAGTFRVAPTYDVAVYYAVLSIMPTLIWFVVSVETAFYPKFRMYYDAILGHGTIADIDRGRKEIEQVLFSELAKLMGFQFAFSILFLALGIKFLPFIGFTAHQIDTFNILIMAFYVYVMISIVLLLLLYFDDRVGALWVSASFFVLNIVAALIFSDNGYQGLPLFVASFPTLLVALGRLIYRIRQLHYVTFSAQPLIVRRSEEA